VRVVARCYIVLGDTNKTSILTLMLGGPNCARGTDPCLLHIENLAYICANLSPSRPCLLQSLAKLLSLHPQATVESLFEASSTPQNVQPLLVYRNAGLHEGSREAKAVRNVVRPDSTRSSVPASRPAAPSSCRPAGTPIPCRAFLRPRLRNHAFSPVPHRPTRKALDLDPTTGCGKSSGPRFPSSPVWLRFTFVVLSLHRSAHCSW
jgi:hypothetical protein